MTREILLELHKIDPSILLGLTCQATYTNDQGAISFCLCPFTDHASSERAGVHVSTGIDNNQTLLFKIAKDVSITSKVVAGLAKTVSYSLSLSVEANFKLYNPWENLSKKSGSQTERLVNVQRQNFLEFYGLVESTNFCMLTGRNAKLKLAHLLPVNVKYVIVKALSMEGKINDFRNNLLLSENVEEAYDAQRISFVPSENILHSNEFVMKIWDENVLNEYIYRNNTSSNALISDFVNIPLKLSMPNGEIHEPFKRCLAFHNFMCFMKWSLYHGELKQNIEDFAIGSEHSGTWLQERKFYLDRLNKRLSEDTENVDDDLDDGLSDELDMIG